MQRTLGALKALPAMEMGPGTLGFSQSALNFCSYCNQNVKQIMLAAWWTLLATGAGGMCRQSGFRLSPGCLPGQVRCERAGFHSSGKCIGVYEGYGGASPRTAPCIVWYAEPQTARSA